MNLDEEEGLLPVADLVTGPNPEREGSNLLRMGRFLAGRVWVFFFLTALCWRLESVFPTFRFCGRKAEDDDDSGLMDIFTCSNPDRGSDIDRDMDSGRVVSNALKAAGNGGGGG